MNICLIAYSFYEGDIRIRRYAEIFLKNGHSVDVIALRRKNQSKYEFWEGVNLYRIQKREYTEKGMYSYFFRILSFFIIGTIVLLKKFYKKRYKIIHVHSVPDFLIFMALIPKMLGSKIILDIHDILPEFFCQKFNKSFDSVFAKILLFIEKISVKVSNHVIAANHIWREKIIFRNKIHPDKITAILNYPDLNLYSKRDAKKLVDSKLTIIYPGHLSYIHGVDILIESMSILKQKNIDFILKIFAKTGSKDFRNYLLKLIKNYNLTENVIFEEPVPLEHLIELYKDFDIGIVPKRSGIFSSEAFSTKIFEFMAAGVPIIASRTKIDEYYFDDSMIMFFKPGNIRELAQCIIDLSENPEKRALLTNNARKYVEKYSWDLRKEEYITVVNSLTT